MLSPRDAPALVMIGMRTDFYARSATYYELVPYLQDCQVLVGPMDQDALRAAIERPPASAGLVVDAGLVEVLLTDLGLHPRPSSPLASAQTPGKEAGSSGQVRPAGDSYEAGRLPLLAYSLQQTWQHREGPAADRGGLPGHRRYRTRRTAAIPQRPGPRANKVAASPRLIVRRAAQAMGPPLQPIEVLHVALRATTLQAALTPGDQCGARRAGRAARPGVPRAARAVANPRRGGHAGSLDAKRR